MKIKVVGLRISGTAGRAHERITLLPDLPQRGCADAICLGPLVDDSTVQL
jgi:hypothetical protein